MDNHFDNFCYNMIYRMDLLSELLHKKTGLIPFMTIDSTQIKEREEIKHKNNNKKNVRRNKKCKIFRKKHNHLE